MSKKKNTKRRRFVPTFDKCEDRILLAADLTNGVMEIGVNLDFLFQEASSNLLSVPSGNTLPNGFDDLERRPYAFRSGIDWSTAYSYNATTGLSDVNPWRQEFLDDLEIYDRLRMIHWTNTNGSGIETWSQATDPNTDQRQLSLFGTTSTSTPSNGVAWEWVVDLANRTEKDIWINIPLTADDNYVQQLGCLLESTLDPDLDVYVEYHNELWLQKDIIGDVRNTTQYAQDMAIAEGIDDGTGGFGNVLRWQAHRSAEIWDMLDTEFGASFGDRVVKVIAGQQTVTNTSEQLRDFLRDPTVNLTSPQQLEDTFATAPYFEAAITDPNDFATLEAAADAQVTQTGLHVDIWGTVGTPVISYEGGQSLIGSNAPESVVFGMNYDPRIKDLYLDYLQGLEDEGLESFNHFTHSSYKLAPTNNSDAAWGGKAFTGQPAAFAPKYQALSEFAGVPIEDLPLSPMIHDGPVATFFTAGSSGTTTNIAAEASWVTQVSASDLVAGAGVGDQTNGWFNNEFAPIGWTSATLADAINSDQYISFSVTVEPGHAMDVTALEGRIRNQNQDRDFALLSSATGFDTASVLHDFGGPITGGAPTDVTLDLTGISGLENLHGTVEFRIYVSGNPAAFEASGIGFATTGPSLELHGKVYDSLVVLPLGDSITQAEYDSSDPARQRPSYREPLQQLLNEAGIRYDFVGSQNTYHGDTPPAGFPSVGFDPDHEGHWGWTADQFVDSNGDPLASWIPNYTAEPDVVLFHLSTNDIINALPGGHSAGVNDLTPAQVSDIAGKVEDVVDTLVSNIPNPDLKILIAQLIPGTLIDEEVQAVNAEIYDIAASYPSVHLVDQYTGFNASTDTYDALHPNATGEQKMADKWFAGLISTSPSVQYSFDSGTAQDDAGNHDGTLVGNASIDFDAAFGPVLSVTGGSDAMQVAHDPTLEVGANDSDFTVAFWVKPDESPAGNWRLLAQKGNSTSDRTFALWRFPNSNRVHYRISTTANANEGGNSVGALKEDAWNHLAYVKEGSNLSLYINGKLDSTSSLNGASVGNNGPIRLGGSPYSGGMASSYDDFAVFDDALSAGRIYALASAKPIAGYSFDAGTAADDVGSRDGILQGAAAIVNVPTRGQVLDVSGNADGVQIPHDSHLDLGANDGDFSVAFWVKPEAAPNGNWRLLTQKGNNLTERTFAMWMFPNSNRVHYRISTDVNQNEGGNSVAALETDAWNHVGYVKSGDQLQLYINGELDSAVTLSGMSVANDGPIHFGGSTLSAGTDALYDDLLLYRRALDGADVKRLFKSQPLAGYSFESGTVNDDIGNRNGVLNGTATVTADPTRSQVLDVAGGADRIEIAHDSGLQLGENDDDFSVAFWIKPEVAPSGSWRLLAHKGNNLTQRAFAMWMLPNSNRVQYRISTDANFNEGGNSVGALTTGIWNHIGYVKEGNELKLYINGELDSSVVLSGMSVGNNGPIRLGGSAFGNAISNGTDAKYDDFLLFDSALSDYQIALLAAP